MNRPQLKTSEWVFSVGLFFFFITVFCIAQLTSVGGMQRLRCQQQFQPIPQISIDISGCVYRPGRITVPCGSPIHSVLRKARLKPLADLSAIDGNAVLTSSGSLFVPTLQSILVEVRGCVDEPKTYTLPAYSRICDLKKVVNPAPDADLGFFKHRRLLKNHEIVQIPAQGK